MIQDMIPEDRVVPVRFRQRMGCGSLHHSFSQDSCLGHSHDPDQFQNILLCTDNQSSLDRVYFRPQCTPRSHYCSRYWKDLSVLLCPAGYHKYLGLLCLHWMVWDLQNNLNRKNNYKIKQN